MALGASAGSVLSAVLGKAFRYVATGLALGLAGALTVSHKFESLVVGITVTGRTHLLRAAPVLLAIGLVAALVPALRASRVDPLVALRAE